MVSPSSSSALDGSVTPVDASVVATAAAVAAAAAAGNSNVESPLAGTQTEESDAPSTPSASAVIDHVLLESLFYNEMMMINGGNDSDGGLSVGSIGELPDPSTLAEQALLRDFGVNTDDNDAADESALPGAQKEVAERHHAQRQQSPLHQQTTKLGTPSSRGAKSKPPTPEMMQQLLKNRKNRGIRHGLKAPTSQSENETVAPIVVSSTVPDPQGTMASSSSAEQGSNQTTIHAHSSSNVAVASEVPSAKQAPQSGATDVANSNKSKLVTQFATLASRLGINLPPEVLESLSSNAGASTTPTASPSPLVAAISPPPAVKQLETTAEAAIAAVTETRKRPLVDSGTADNTNSDGGTASSNTRPSYNGKRRKKPRLQDCEEKLAQLKSENELLKRHLSTVMNQSHKTDVERQQLEQKMRRMLDEKSNASDAEIDTMVQKFSDHYSDYGKRRHSELAFHLDQLQRLANPTNFTKMGLWTLGHQSSMKESSNPIAGILQKELGMTGQQGRKILEQRQKIREVCTNLSECLGLLSKLKHLCEQKTKIFHDRIQKCREILTPRQVVKLMIWIDEHSDTLDTVCPGWGSEQMHGRSK